MKNSPTDGRIQAASVVLIGRPTGPAFQDLERFLHRHESVNMRGEFDTIAQAMADLLVPDAAVDIVIVLQAFSDEYSATEAGLLIGRMLFRRLFCCYGPWCGADGRSHEVWPVSLRVPIDSAIPVIAREIDTVLNAVPPLLPLAAAEEVFAHRLQRQAGAMIGDETPIVVISEERELRDTTTAICRNLRGGLRPSSVKATHFQAAAEMLRDLSGVSPSGIAIVDLDPLDGPCQEFLELLQRKFSTWPVLGLTVFSPDAFSLPQLQTIVNKTELLIGLGWALRSAAFRP